MRKRDLAARIEALAAADDDTLERVLALNDRLAEVERHVMSRGRDEGAAGADPASSTPLLYLVIEPSPGGLWCLSFNGTLMLNSSKARVIAEAARWLDIEDASGRPRPSTFATVELRKGHREEVDALRAEVDTLRAELAAATAERERLIPLVSQAAHELEWYGAGKDEIQAARGFLIEALHPGFGTAAPKPSERSRLAPANGTHPA